MARGRKQASPGALAAAQAGRATAPASGSASDGGASYAFPKERRLRKRAEFLRVQREGQSVRARHFTLLVSSRQEPSPARLGLVASRKIGSAVARNRGKRRAREWFRHAAGKLPAGIDIVIILRRGAGELSPAAVTGELDAALPKLLRLARGPAPSPSRRGPPG